MQEHLPYLQEMAAKSCEKRWTMQLTRDIQPRNPHNKNFNVITIVTADDIA